ncbi:MAG: 4Fe-4S binding protein [Kiritimatiellia bacterium]
MKKALKFLVAAIFLGAVTASFFGLPYVEWACKVQPSAAWPFLAVLLLTPLVGRFFCETMCPLGILQTVVNRIVRPHRHVRRVCTRLPVTKVQWGVRFGVLAVGAALVGLGCGGLAWSLTPYALYGKALTLFVPGVALFVIVLGLAAFGEGRVWCNWICPAGTLFTLLSRKAVCAHKVGPGCANCRRCLAKTGGDAGAAKEGITRREALQGVAVLAAAEAVEKTVDGGYAPISLPGSPARPATVLPPGALARTAFERVCVACGLCIANCPEKCLKPSMKLATLGQPEMDFRYGYCRTDCTTCSSVCPTVALTKLTREEKRNTHLGHAIWKKDRCIRTTDGVACTACTRKCPVHAIHIIEGFPVVDKTACLGCGACEHVCPARPLPAIFVKGFEAQRTVRPMPTQMKG